MKNIFIDIAPGPLATTTTLYPVVRSSGIVNLYRQGRRIKGCIYCAEQRWLPVSARCLVYS
ncbi:MAG: hypothetical protein LBC70_01245 [Chitinispirillales bacterium]|nr:hypothetical protein [Chitinispirillales bacterium]